MALPFVAYSLGASVVAAWRVVLWPVDRARLDAPRPFAAVAVVAILAGVVLGSRADLGLRARFAQQRDRFDEEVSMIATDDPAGWPKVRSDTSLRPTRSDPT